MPTKKRSSKAIHQLDGNVRRGRATGFDALFGSLLNPALRSRGLMEHSLVRRWREVVPAHAAYSYPVKLVRGVLTLAVPSDAAKMMLLMEQPLIIDEINRFYGYDAVHGLSFTLRQFAQPKLVVSVKPPDEGALTRAAARCADIKNNTLRQAFTALGARVEEENVRETTS